jgi:hypothetical protein
MGAGLFALRLFFGEQKIIPYLALLLGETNFIVTQACAWGGYKIAASCLLIVKRVGARLHT